ncbi:MAG: hypothetical protein MUE69_12870 [Myxococcota bacterium]|nr:hypothetical protein [Myxococcota bacterium]
MHAPSPSALGRSCPAGSPSCIEWQLAQPKLGSRAQGDWSQPWYSYAVRRGVPSPQNRAAKIASPFSVVSIQSGSL